MRIRMVQDRTGPRWDGQAWPPRGGEIDVPDDEGAAVCEHGWAEPVAEWPPPEEQRAADPPRSTRPRSSPASSARGKAGDAGG